MLRCIIAIYTFLFTICSYASHSFDCDEKHQSTHAFYRLQDKSFKDTILKPSILTEIRQNLLRSHIENLGLERLENVKCRRTHLGENNIDDILRDKELLIQNAKNFIGGEYTIIDTPAANTLILINLRADNGIQEPKTLSYFTTPEIFLSCDLILDYFDRLAILNEWTSYSHFTVSIIPQGTHIRGIVGLTELKESEFKKNIENISRKNLYLYTPRLGGAPQLFISSAYHCEHYDLGAFSNQSNFDFFIKDKKINRVIAEKDYRPLLMVALKSPFSHYQNPYRVIYKIYSQCLDFYKSIPIVQNKTIQPWKPSYLQPVKTTSKSIVLFKFASLQINQTQIFRLIQKIIR